MNISYDQKLQQTSLIAVGVKSRKIHIIWPNTGSYVHLKQSSSFHSYTGIPVPTRAFLWYQYQNLMLFPEENGDTSKTMKKTQSLPEEDVYSVNVT